MIRHFDTIKLNPYESKRFLMLAIRDNRGQIEEKHRMGIRSSLPEELIVMRLWWLYGVLLAAIPAAWSAPIRIGLKSTDVAVSAARRHSERVRMVQQEGFPEGAATLAEGAAPLPETGDDRTADLTFEIRAEKPGRYLISAVTAVDDYGRSLIPKWKRTTQDFSVKMWFDEGRPTHRTAFSPWLKAGANRTALGRFQLTGRTQRLHLQLPRGVRLMRLIFAP